MKKTQNITGFLFLLLGRIENKMVPFDCHDLLIVAFDAILSVFFEWIIFGENPMLSNQYSWNWHVASWNNALHINVVNDEGHLYPISNGRRQRLHSLSIDFGKHGWTCFFPIRPRKTRSFWKTTLEFSSFSIVLFFFQIRLGAMFVWFSVVHGLSVTWHFPLVLWALVSCVSDYFSGIKKLKYRKKNLSHTVYTRA